MEFWSCKGVGDGEKGVVVQSLMGLRICGVDEGRSGSHGLLLGNDTNRDT